MYCRWILFQLEIKKFIKILPVIFLETLLFGLVLLVAGKYATKAIYGGKVVSEIQVGVVAEDEDKTTDMLLRLVEGMDSIKDTASFALMSEGEAREKLGIGEIYAAVIIPEGLLDGIRSGKNIPARILLGNAQSKMETEVFAQLSRAGAELLTTAQAGIYAADAFCGENNRTDLVKQTEDYLNAAYIKYALERSALFKEKEVNAVRGVNLTDYYSISLLLAFLSFAGLSFGRYMQIDMGERERIIKSRGIGVLQQYFIETAAFSAIFAFLGTLLSVPLYLFVSFGGKSSFSISFTWIFVPVIWFLVGIFLRMLFQFVGNQAGGIGVGFLILMMVMLASGIFIPSAFLPVWVEKAGSCAPYKIWTESTARILQGRFDAELAVRAFLITLFTMAAGALAAVGRERQSCREMPGLRGRKRV